MDRGFQEIACTMDRGFQEIARRTKGHTNLFSTM